MGKRAAEHGITAWLHVTNLSRGVNIYYVLRNMLSEIFSLGEITIHQIFFCQCVHAMNSPNFPTAKVSLHTVHEAIVKGEYVQYTHTHACRRSDPLMHSKHCTHAYMDTHM